MKLNELERETFRQFAAQMLLVASLAQSDAKLLSVI
jgi:hypothetical protein